MAISRSYHNKINNSTSRYLKRQKERGDRGYDRKAKSDQRWKAAGCLVCIGAVLFTLTALVLLLA